MKNYGNVNARDISENTPLILAVATDNSRNRIKIHPANEHILTNIVLIQVIRL